MATRPPGTKPRGRRDAAQHAPIRVGGRQAASQPGAADGKGAGVVGPSGREPGAGELEGSQYRTDEFRMFCLKVLQCSKRYCHDWTTCPFAHPGEKARRRDPRKFRYTGIACPEMKQGVGCPRGERCPFAHNVFEYWLHPSRYRTQLCNIAASCNRKICFFAHTIEELRVPAPVGGVDATQLLAGSAGQGLAGTRRAQHHGPGRAAYRTPRRAAATEPVRRVTAPEPSPRDPALVPSSLYGHDHFGHEHGGHEHPACGHAGPSRDTSTYSESQARQLLEMLRSTRQQALQVHPSVPFADVQQVQALLSILQQQQQRQAAAQKAADSEASMTQALQNCLSALYCQVTTQPMSEGERERLIKMLTWIFMMVQSQSLQAFGGDMQGPWDSPASQQLVLGAGINLDHPPPAIPERTTSSFSDRGSLCSIPEMQMAAGLDSSMSVSPMQAGQGQPQGRSPLQWGGSRGEVMMQPLHARVDSGEVHRRRPPSEVGNPAMVAQAVTTRLSSESGWSARMSAASEGGWTARMGTPRGSAHSSGESAVTELWGMISRQSGSSTTSAGRLSDMQDAWMHDYRR